MPFNVSENHGESLHLWIFDESIRVDSTALLSPGSPEFERGSTGSAVTRMWRTGRGEEAEVPMMTRPSH